MPSYKLTYFNMRGRAEAIRMIMAYGEIEYEDNRMPFPPNEEWAKLKPTMPFHQVPVLEVDGVQICQRNVIARFLAKKIGLHGKSDLEEAKLDMVVACFEDITAPLGFMMREYGGGTKRTFTSGSKNAQMMLKVAAGDIPEEQAEKVKAYQESWTVGLNKLEKFIEGDYFLGNQISWADIAVTDTLDFFSTLGFGTSIDKFPKLAGLVARVKAEPKIAAWIAKRPETPV